MAKNKQRLDQLLVARALVDSRERGRRQIMAGKVLVNGQVSDKPGMQVPTDAEITLKAKPRFVSRGGDKLLAAFEQFPLDVQGAICADVGASTGGFTDCLLQHGAVRVYAIDVGKGILHWQLRNDPRVVVMESTNARHLAALPEAVQVITCDAAFISLRLLLPAMAGWLAGGGQLVVLIKPQFEAGRGQVGRKGVVRDPAIRRATVIDVLTVAESLGLTPTHLIRSPLRGPAGNLEFLARLVPGGAGPGLEALLGEVV